MIKVENLTKIYKSKNKNNCVALDNISFELPEKGLVFVIGKSGSGKSTLLNLLGGLDSKTSGNILVNGNEISSLNDNKLISYRSSMVGFIFQDFHLLDDLTVEENIGVSLKLQDKYNIDEINDVLIKVDLEGYNNRYPNELSGGQKQRVAIARALVKNPNLILADEPTGNLDSNTTKQIIEIIKEISKEKLVIIVSHNLYDAYEYADRIIELSEGRILNDLELNKNYSNKIKIEENQLILPLLKRFNSEELDYVLNECRTNKSINKIVQDDSKYIKYTPKEYESTHLLINKSKLSFYDTLNFSYLFGKKRFIRFVLSALMAAMIIVVLALSQSIAYFNDAKIIQDELMNNTSSVYSIRKNVDSTKGEALLKGISNKDLELFNVDGVEAYKVYNDCIYFSGSSYQTVSRDVIPTIQPGTLTVGSTFGVLETNEEYAKKILGVSELDIYTNNIPYRREGIYITDFVADSMVSTGYAKNYNQALGEIYESTPYYWGYVNGIIQTGYKDKYSSLIKEIKQYKEIDSMTEEILDFYDYIVQALAMGFTFETDYKNLAINNKSKSWEWTLYSFIDNIDTSLSIRHVSYASFFNKDLQDNEIMMDYVVYNSIFDTEYNKSNLSTFEPHTCVFKVKNDYNDTLIEKEVLIKEIFQSNSSKVFVSDEFMAEYREKTLFYYGIYFDTNNLESLINLTIENEYVPNSIKMAAVQTMTKAVSVFNTFFDIIVFILITACLFIIISFGVKNVKSNMYEIGVLKALGCKFINFAIMFVLHTLIIVIMIVAFSFIGYYLFSGLANTVLVESLRKLATSHVVIDLNFISFDYVLMLFNSLIVLIIALFSTIIPITILKKIEPITIIKAKE